MLLRETSRVFDCKSTDSITELNGHNFSYSSLLYGGWFAAAAAAAVANKTPPSHLFGLQGK